MDLYLRFQKRTDLSSAEKTMRDNGFITDHVSIYHSESKGRGIMYAYGLDKSDNLHPKTTDSHTRRKLLHDYFSQTTTRGSDLVPTRTVPSAPTALPKNVIRPSAILFSEIPFVPLLHMAPPMVVASAKNGPKRPVDKNKRKNTQDTKQQKQKEQERERDIKKYSIHELEVPPSVQMIVDKVLSGFSHHKHSIAPLRPDGTPHPDPKDVKNIPKMFKYEMGKTLGLHDIFLQKTDMLDHLYIINDRIAEIDAIPKCLVDAALVATSFGIDRTNVLLLMRTLAFIYEHLDLDASGNQSNPSSKLWARKQQNLKKHSGINHHNKSPNTKNGISIDDPAVRKAIIMDMGHSGKRRFGQRWKLVRRSIYDTLPDAMRADLSWTDFLEVWFSVYAHVTVVENILDKRERSSLYPLCSLIEHSCRPNCVIVQDEMGLMSCRAVDYIFPGDPITINYMDKWYENRDARQFFLFFKFHFVCHCADCSAGVPDLSRAFWCATCKKGVVYPSKRPCIKFAAYDDFAAEYEGNHVKAENRALARSDGRYSSGDELPVEVVWRCESCYDVPCENRVQMMLEAERRLIDESFVHEASILGRIARNEISGTVDFAQEQYNAKLASKKKARFATTPFSHDTTTGGGSTSNNNYHRNAVNERLLYHMAVSHICGNQSTESSEPCKPQPVCDVTPRQYVDASVSVRDIHPTHHMLARFVFETYDNHMISDYMLLRNAVYMDLTWNYDNIISPFDPNKTAGMEMVFKAHLLFRDLRKAFEAISACYIICTHILGDMHPNTLYYAMYINRIGSIPDIRDQTQAEMVSQVKDSYAHDVPPGSSSSSQNSSENGPRSFTNVMPIFSYLNAQDKASNSGNDNSLFRRVCRYIKSD